MKVTTDKTENRQAFLTIEMEPAEVEASLEKSYRHLVQKVAIPGFRKGKAPRVILERHMSRQALLEDALHHLVPEAYEKAISEQKIEAIAHPHIDIVQTEPLVFKATVPLLPTVKLGDYHQLRLTPEPVTFSEAEVNAVIERLRHQHATWEPVERPVDFTDRVVLDIESSIEDRPFINQKGAQYQVLRDLPAPVPGFVEQLVGMRRGEEPEFKLRFPADYPGNELAGKEASFKVRITEIKQEKLLELNDELAREIDPECPTLDRLREKVTAELRLRAEEKTRIDFEERVVQAAVDQAEVEFPPILVEMEMERLVNRQARYWQMSRDGLDEYLKSINKTGEELREELRPLATKRVTRALVLGKVIEGEKIEVSNPEVETEIENLVKGVGENKDALQKSLNTAEARESIKDLLASRKAVQRLVEIARGSNTEIEKEAEKE